MRAGPTITTIAAVGALATGGVVLHKKLNQPPEAGKPTPVAVSPAEEGKRDSEIEDTRKKLHNLVAPPKDNDGEDGDREDIVPPGEQGAGAEADEEAGVDADMKERFKNSPGAREFCKRGLLDPSPSVRGTKEKAPEQFRVIQGITGTRQAFMECHGVILTAKEVGDETVLTDPDGNETVIDKHFGQEGLGGTATWSGSLKTNLVGEIAYKRTPRAEVQGLRDDKDRLTRQNTELREKLDEAIRKLNVMIARNPALAKEIEELQKELDCCRKQLAECEDALKKCKPEEKGECAKKKGHARRRHEETTRKIEKRGEELGFGPGELNMIFARHRIMNTDRTYQADDGRSGNETFVGEGSHQGHFESFAPGGTFDSPDADDGSFHMEE